MTAARAFVSGIVLAAGRASRMGRPKMLLPLAGKPMLQHALDAAERSPLDEVVVVLGEDAAETWAALRPGPRTRVAVNPRAAEGQSTSLRAGLQGVSVESQAALVMLGDQPEVRVEAVAEVVAAFRGGAGPVVQASYGGRPGHPVLFVRATWDEVAASAGDEGARGLLAGKPGWVATVEVGGDVPPDVDTEEDYRAAIARMGGTEGGGR